MLQRIRQFIAAVTARVTPEDREFVNAHLTLAQQALFWNMNLPEQRHALNVAYTAQELAAGRADIDHRLLTASALLHDIGKVRGDISIPDKVATVLADKFCPQAARSWAREGRGNRLDNLRHALYIYYHHASRGAAVLERGGDTPDLVRIVRCHHLPPEPGEPAELAILRKADELN